jgi:hypothetical protein
MRYVFKTTKIFELYRRKSPLNKYISPYFLQQHKKRFIVYCWESDCTDLKSKQLRLLMVTIMLLCYYNTLKISSMAWRI